MKRSPQVFPPTGISAGLCCAWFHHPASPTTRYPIRTSSPRLPHTSPTRTMAHTRFCLTVGQCQDFDITRTQKRTQSVGFNHGRILTSDLQQASQFSIGIDPTRAGSRSKAYFLAEPLQKEIPLSRTPSNPSERLPTPAQQRTIIAAPSQAASRNVLSTTSAFGMGDDPPMQTSSR